MNNPEPATDHERCGARKRSDGTPCRMPAGHGTDHVGVGPCRLHGGSTKNHKIAAERAIARREAEAVIARFQIPKDLDPVDVIAEELGRCNVWVEWLDSKIAELSDEQLIRGVTRVKNTKDADGNTTTETVIEAKPHAWVVMAREERARLVEAAKAAATLGIENRRIRLAEDMGRAIVHVVTGVLTDLGINDREDVPAIVRRRLLAVNATPTTAQET